MAVNATILFPDGNEFEFEANALPVTNFTQRFTRNNTKHKLLSGVDFTQLLGVGAAELTLSGKYYPTQNHDPLADLRNALWAGTLVTLHIYGVAYDGLHALRLESTGQDFYGNRAQAVTWTLALRQQGVFTPSTVADVGRTTPPEPCLLYTSPSPRDRQKSRMPSSA